MFFCLFYYDRNLKLLQTNFNLSFDVSIVNVFKQNLTYIFHSVVFASICTGFVIKYPMIKHTLICFINCLNIKKRINFIKKWFMKKQKLYTQFENKFT